MASTVIGKATIVPKGAYNPATEYWRLCVVTDGGNSYMYVGDTPSTGTALTDPRWLKIAEKGDSGPAGATAYDMAVLGGYTKTQAEFYEDLARLDNMPPSTWGEFQAAVRNGTIDRYHVVGDQFAVTRGATTLVFDLVDIGSSTRNVAANGNAPSDPDYFTNFPNAKPVTLMMRDVINSVMFDQSEANYQITTQINSGTQCNIVLASTGYPSASYDFTAPQNLVVGGRLRIGNATTLQYYATPTSAAVNIPMAAGTAYPSISGSLSTQNQLQRVHIGYNNHETSAIRQFLNASGAAGTYWTSQSIYDIAPPWQSSLAGIKNGMPPDFLTVIGKTTREVEQNTITDGGGNATFSDDFFLPSAMEIYGVPQTVTPAHKGVQFQAFVGSVDADKIKYDSANLSSVRSWWLRTPVVGAAYSVISVNPTGGQTGSGCYTGWGVAAACVIL